MTTEHGPDNIILVLLRRIDATLDRVIEDVHGLKISVSALEQQDAGVSRRLDLRDAVA